MLTRPIGRGGMYTHSSIRCLATSFVGWNKTESLAGISDRHAGIEEFGCPMNWTLTRIRQMPRLPHPASHWRAAVNPDDGQMQHSINTQ